MKADPLPQRSIYMVGRVADHRPSPRAVPTSPLPLLHSHPSINPFIQQSSSPSSILHPPSSPFPWLDPPPSFNYIKAVFFPLKANVAQWYSKGLVHRRSVVQSHFIGSISPDQEPQAFCRRGHDSSQRLQKQESPYRGVHPMALNPWRSYCVVMNEKAQDAGYIPQVQPSPISEPSWVQCKGYRCLAVWDKKGKWKSYSTGAELIDFLRVCV